MKRVKCPLPSATLVFDHPTADAVVDYLLHALRGATPATRPPSDLRALTLQSCNVRQEAAVAGMACRPGFFFLTFVIYIVESCVDFFYTSDFS